MLMIMFNRWPGDSLSWLVGSRQRETSFSHSVDAFLNSRIVLVKIVLCRAPSWRSSASSAILGQAKLLLGLHSFGFEEKSTRTATSLPLRSF